MSWERGLQGWGTPRCAHLPWEVAWGAVLCSPPNTLKSRWQSRGPCPPAELVLWAVPMLQACHLEPTSVLTPPQELGTGSKPPGQAQRPVSRAESLRSMHTLHLAMFSTSAWSLRMCCSPSMSRRALW